MREANQTIRDLLLEKGHLVPQDLLADASRLVAHYDRWLEKYEATRAERETDGGGGATALTADDIFVSVASDGYPFPVVSANNFHQRFRDTWKELYGD